MSIPEKLSTPDAEIVRRVTREESRAILAERLIAAIEARELAQQAWKNHERRYGAEVDSMIHVALDRAGIVSLETFRIRP